MDIEKILAQPDAAELIRLVKDSVELPPLPVVASKVMGEINREDATTASVARLVEKDQGLAALILRMANSSFYQRSTPVAGIREAISFLGFKRTRNLVLAQCTRGLFREVGGPEEAVWEHCVATSIAAHVLAWKERMWYREEALIAGLMHDVGKILLASHDPDRFAQCVDQARQEGIESHVAERKAFNITHMAVGYALLKEWKLLECHQKAVLLHHHLHMTHLKGALEFMAKEREVVCLTHLADRICHVAGIGGPATPADPPLSTNPAVLILGFEKDQIDGIVTEIEERFADERGLFG